MQHFQYILFDCDTQLQFSSSFDVPDIRETFVSALRRGDRAVFYRFCKRQYDPDKPEFYLFQLADFPYGEYVFLEKDLFHGKTVNIVYFSPDAAAFYPLMSPTSQYYRDVTGRCIYDILRASYEKTTDAPFLTPAAFLSIDNIPTLRDDLLRVFRLPEYCDLRLVVKKITSTMLGLPTFAKTKICLTASYAEQLLSNAHFDEEATSIIEFSLRAYVFILTALLQILHTLADDHQIHIHLFFEKEAANSILEIKVGQECSTEIDNSSLLSLSELVPSLESLLKIATVIAYDAEIRTILSYSAEENVLRTKLVLDTSYQSIPSFHYRDPYTPIPSMVTEFAVFCEKLLHLDEESQS